MATAKATAARRITYAHIPRDGEPGEPGAPGPQGPYCPPPMLWQDYPDGYAFQAGRAGVDERLDVVGEENGSGGIDWYRCLKNHVKSSATRPSASYTMVNPVWEAAMLDAGMLATRVLLADNAYIDLLSTRGVRVYDSSSNITGALSNSADYTLVRESFYAGSSTTWGGGTVGPVVGPVTAPAAETGTEKAAGGTASTSVSTNVCLPFWLGGRLNADGSFATPPNYAVAADGTVHVGGIAAGARVVLDPKGPDIAVHRPDGDVAVRIDGYEHTPSEFTADSTTLAFPASEVGDTYPGDGEKTVAFTGSVKSSGGRLEVSVPVELRTALNVFGPSADGRTGPRRYYSRASARLQLLLASNGTVIDETEVSFSGDSIALPIPETGKSAFKAEIRPFTMQFNPALRPGEYTLRVVLAVESGTGCSGWAAVSATPSVAYSAATALQTRLCASGLLIALSASEYLRVYSETDSSGKNRIRLEARSNGHTLSFGKDGFKQT